MSEFIAVDTTTAYQSTAEAVCTHRDCTVLQLTSSRQRVRQHVINTGHEVRFVSTAIATATYRRRTS